MVCGCVKTGVPFGDSVLVREFLHITNEVYHTSIARSFILSFFSPSRLMDHLTSDIADWNRYDAG